jgi:hypothetical protein
MERGLISVIMKWRHPLNHLRHTNRRPRFSFGRRLSGFFGRWIRCQRPFLAARGEPNVFGHLVGNRRVGTASEGRMRKFKLPVVVYGACLTVAVFILLNGTPVASYFRSEDDTFTQLMGYINKGQSRARVRWIYYRERASTMRLNSEKADVWIVSGREHGEPARFIIRFLRDRVDAVRVELL